MFNIDPRQMEKVMKQMGMKQEGIPANEVVIKTTGGKKIIIKNPQVIRISMQGNESFQISGEIIEEARADEESNISNNFSEEDVETVVEQTGASKDKAKTKLIENKGNLAKTILDLKNKI
ncbi:MAG: Nascent polypeptide-associated complex protein [Candidatus Huberarchaeum crystalense]|uniref:Nascent polypeptide-associated complex protein n=1 Tax=Huberarchaeum crystalense TaxID=2014257 RepID=A0A2G9LKW7_HUBC1|nr:Nascent polypeptide-associated complex protein [archaeon]OIP20531.1 MAG: hypothetical protein AUJ91_01105 [archaeon CG2_30_31_98]PIN66810.1 MAG: Nascent polypeptide-associated complex protein [Candidatus Huberarchaeum crystalense]NCS98323.1 Nascent polypeptide-associated complex protein [archaeon]PIV13933.1 MAG: Nascent polypeptide-associated complex protein [Candidatus Huberarchaeum crystalense]